MYGFQVYETEVDDRGVDFVTRYMRGPFLEIQVKALRSKGYAFMEKSKFRPDDRLYLALGLLHEGHPPDLYLIPSSVWLIPDAIFVDRNYDGLKSRPEWGVNVSKKNIGALEPYLFASSIERIVRDAGA